MAVVEETRCLLLGLCILYSLNLGGIITSASLISISSGPTCACYPEYPYALSCRVGYIPSIGSDVLPVVTWKSSSGEILKIDQNVPISLVGSDAGLRVAASLFPVGANDSAVTECQVTLSSVGPLGTIVQQTLTASCNVSSCLSVSITTVKGVGQTTVAVPETTTPKKNVVVQTTVADPEKTTPKKYVVAQTTVAEPETTQIVQRVTEQASTVKTTTPYIAQNCSGENLTNTVVYEGAPTSFSVLDNGQAVQWQGMPSSQTYAQTKNITNYDDEVRPEFIYTYAVNKSQLIIFNSTVTPQALMNYSTAGLYILRYRNPNCTTAANLIVIRSGPVCARNATSQGNVTTLSCTVIFASSYVQPTNPMFKWTKDGEVEVKQEKPIPKQMDSYTRRSSSQLSVATDDVATYRCLMTFSAPPKSPYTYIAPTAPDVKASCSVSRWER